MGNLNIHQTPSIPSLKLQRERSPCQHTPWRQSQNHYHKNHGGRRGTWSTWGSGKIFIITPKRLRVTFCFSPVARISLIFLTNSAGFFCLSIPTALNRKRKFIFFIFKFFQCFFSLLLVFATFWCFGTYLNIFYYENNIIMIENSNGLLTTLKGKCLLVG